MTGLILTVNGAARELTDDTTLADVVEHEVGAASRGSAAAVDGEVVPRSVWPTLLLLDGQSVEILTAVQGG